MWRVPSPHQLTTSGERNGVKMHGSSGNASTALKRKRLLFPVLLTTFLVSFAAGVSVAGANAGNASGSYGFFTAGSTQYINFASIATSSNVAQATTSTSRNASTTPSGWAGSRGRLFTSGGSLSCEGSTTYNSGTIYGYHEAVSCIRFTSGTWYSYGVSYGYNGSGYNASYTYLSPNQAS